MMNAQQRSDLLDLLDSAEAKLPDSLKELRSDLHTHQKKLRQRVRDLEVALVEAAELPVDGAWLELHIWPNNARFTPTIRRKIKDMGGRYSACRGHRLNRVVHVPCTPAGRIMAVWLLTAGNVAIVRFAGKSKVFVDGWTEDLLHESANLLVQQHRDARILSLETMLANAKDELPA